VVISEWFDRSEHFEIKTFSKFAIICEESCLRQWNMAFFKHDYLSRVDPKMPSFFSLFRFWSLGNPSVIACRFGHFVGRFVESGMYHYLIRYKKKLLHVRQLNQNGRLQVHNGSLFGLIYAGIEISRMDRHSEIKSTKMSALSGTIILSVFVLVLGFISLVYERYKYLSGSNLI